MALSCESPFRNRLERVATAWSMVNRQWDDAIRRSPVGDDRTDWCRSMQQHSGLVPERQATET